MNTEYSKQAYSKHVRSSKCQNPFFMLSGELLTALSIFTVSHY